MQFAMIVSLALASACSKVLAQGQSWQCTTPYGTYHQNALTIPQGVHTLSGEIQFNKGEYGPKWIPAAYIGFTDSKLSASDGCYCNGISGEMRDDNPGMVTLSLMANGQHTEITRAEVGKPIPFRVSVDDEGTLSVEAGGGSPGMQSAPLVHPQRDTVGMFCSSGDFTFSNLRTE
jgi:hypothetical protein